jgi:CrcB protein
MKIVIVGLGGFFGSICRYLASGFAYRIFPLTLFPIGTITVNVIGCIVLGFLAGLAEFRQVLTPELRSFLLIGFLGSFTTYSTFGLESFQLLRDGQLFSTALNISLHLFLGIGGVWLGHMLSRII